MTAATFLGEVSLPGIPHKVREYRLTPGTATRLEPDGTPGGRIEISGTQAKKAEYTYCLRWISGSVYAVFTLDGTGLAQQIHGEPEPKKPRVSKIAAREAPGVAPPAPGADPTPAKPPRKRKRGANLDPL